MDFFLIKKKCGGPTQVKLELPCNPYLGSTIQVVQNLGLHFHFQNEKIFQIFISTHFQCLRVTFILGTCRYMYWFM